MQVARLTVWKEPLWLWLGFIIVAALLGFIFFEGLRWMAAAWIRTQEYGYGFVIPVITAFFVWQKKDQLELIPFKGSWTGVIVTVAGLGLYVLGELSTLYIIVVYAFLVTLIGLVLAVTGWRVFREIYIPLLLLFFMVPLPSFLYTNLSTTLQLISSELGVAIIRLFDISVYLEGNVIDLGSYKLQVVEACSGLRYLFPLATLAFITAYIFKGPLWARSVIFLSSAPITVFMNSFRIGMIGVLVEYGCKDMAAGFLHDFEGWVIFMACMVILMAEMWLLSRFSSGGRPMREVFGLDFPTATPDGAEVRIRSIPRPFWAAGLALVLCAATIPLLGERVEVTPDRADLNGFPLSIKEWLGKKQRLEPIVLDSLQLDDYLLANYVDAANNRALNLYVAYYASQRKGQSAHSPRTCIPGGGWKITSITQHQVSGVRFLDQPLTVNRTLIEKGENKQLVYYWFQQRGRNLTNEYLVKWYIFWDALTRRRTDGALVRLTMPIGPGEDPVLVEKRLADFTRAVMPLMDQYIPN